jgi:signal transduction histidine kinase/ligand-binding sensor domain-containing protein
VLYALVWPLAALALDPSLDVRQYAHTAWRYRDGFLTGTVNGFTQTPDGYLWLGTQSGVLRFDGVRAAPLRLPPGQRFPSTVVTLFAARDGTLWIGTMDGLASWKNGALTEYPALAGYSTGAILQDRQGTVWAGAWGHTTAKLCAISKGGVVCFGDDGSLGAAVMSLYEDPDGALWVGSSTGVWRWKPGPRIHRIAEPITEWQSFAQGDDKSTVLVAVNNIYQIAAGKVTEYPLRGTPSPLTASNLFRDRNGGFWIGTKVHGLVHSYRGKTSMFTHKDGLSSDSVLAVFEDREGTIWVATDDGVDRFRDPTVSTLSEWQGLSSASPTSLLAARDRSIWIGTMDGLNRWKDGRMTTYRTRSNPGLPGDFIYSLFEDERGRIWISGARGLAVFEEGKFTAVPAVPPGTTNAIEGDNRDGLWLSMWLTANSYGLAHLDRGKIVEQVSWKTLGGGPGSGLVTDRDGGVWTGLITGGIAHFRAGHVERLRLSQQPAVESKVINLFRSSDGAIWAATEDGLARIMKGRITMLTTANGLPCDAVHWIIEDDVSSYWLYTRCGLLRISRTELDAWESDPSRKVQPTAFDSVDGIQLVGAPSACRPMVTKSWDGKIWFLNGHLVSSIDPHNLAFNKLPPPVHIEQVIVDDKPYDATNGMRLPPRVHNLAIDYAALSLVAPEKVHFRVKLEGQDKDWRELVNVRYVEYTNLPPKHYKFRVLACNNSGVWNEEGAALDFVIPPAWYQTNWFRAACIAAFLAMIWGIYELRVRQLAAQFNMRLEERVAERTRVAHDLHDTLLQSFQALLPSLQAGINMLAARPADARKVLEDTADHASQAIAEGRDAVQGLRMSTVEKNDLAVAIRTVGEELASAASTQPPPNFNVVVEGASRNLHPILRDEVYRLAVEALRNAFRHAAAQNVEVEIRYDEKYFRLRVRDDGKGIPSDVLSGDGREGHYGLPGMRERAKLVGGKLAIWTEMDGGTEIELSIPGARAYVKSTRTFWHFGKRSATDTDEKEPIERE